MDLCDATDMTTCFVLASKSPARLRMLRSAGIEPVVIASGADESHLRGEDAVAMTARLSRLKAHSVIESGALEEYPADRMIVVACDSVLNLDGRILGKPHTAERARQWWRRMRGHQGVLVSGHHVAVIVNGQLREQTRIGQTVVTFADLTDAEIDAYVDSGEPAAVAEAFTIDGLGGAFITRINGDPHNVTGISLPLLRQMLMDLDVEWSSLWNGPKGGHLG